MNNMKFKYILLVIALTAVGMFFITVSYYKKNVSSITPIDSIYPERDTIKIINNNIDTLIIDNSKIIYERDERLKNIDSISNDSAVKLFYLLLTE